jgi:hypothetical protein
MLAQVRLKHWHQSQSQSEPLSRLNYSQVHQKKMRHLLVVLVPSPEHQSRIHLQQVQLLGHRRQM